MRTFDIPQIYKSSIIGEIKKKRQLEDPRKQDFSPSIVDLGLVTFIIPRHFGFCFGVENAIEIAYKTIEENKGKNIYFLSQMIHNPLVNDDLESRGIKFIQDTEGNQLIQWDLITKDDIVLIPAFGTTLETENILKKIGVDISKYNTTCPFVERVWKKSEKLGTSSHTVIIHGKSHHEETKATFSHASSHSKSIIVRDISEVEILREFILNERPISEFDQYFKGKYSDGFDPDKDFEKIGVVNQTTMLANETQEISEFMKETMILKYGKDQIKNHFSDTRDTLCYATNDNQQSIYEVMKEEADLAIVAGGYNSSNTTHLCKILDDKFETYFINSHDCIDEVDSIHHYDYRKQENTLTHEFISFEKPLRIILASGASCPDTVLDDIMKKIILFSPLNENITDVLSRL